MRTNPKYAWREVKRADPPKRPPTERIADFREIYSLFDEETVRKQAGRCVQCEQPRCTIGCALGNHIPQWLALVAEGKFQEAAEIIFSTSNMPEICARLCPQERLCESMCTLGEKSDPIPIGALEKFVIEYAFNRGCVPVRRVAPNGVSVAVVGSGPAGLTCADELALRGYAVTVFESKNYAGGLLVYGLPSFKLEKSIVDRRVALIEKRGVTFRLNTAIGRDVTLDSLLGQFDAVFLSMGAHKPKPFTVPGAILKGVHQGVDYLVETKLGPAPGAPPIVLTGKRVVVLGGGELGVDCLRAAIRSGAKKAACIYRRDLDNMPVSHREYRNAVEEGAEFIFLASAVAVEGDSNGNVRQARCVRTRLGNLDAQGRHEAIPIPGAEFVVPADVVLAAYGLAVTPFPQKGEWSRIAVNDSGAVIVDENHMTNLPRVFAGGGQIFGANLVGIGIRDGRSAAQGIHRYLTVLKAAA
ncbi:MAG: NAD(P)-dependent oxidoreductase [Verrucomicrobia bacterium]|nr:NAD(P)-dependent oxidoreductase [Verrucomicrobiota bacterium]